MESIKAHEQASLAICMVAEYTSGDGGFVVIRLRLRQPGLVIGWYKTQGGAERRAIRENAKFKRHKEIG